MPVYRLPHIISRLLFCIVSAAILSVSFSTFNLPFLAWAGLIPLFFILDKTSGREAFILSWVCGCLFFLLSMYWLIHVSLGGWIILSLYQGLYFGIFGIFSSCVVEHTSCVKKHDRIPFWRQGRRYTQYLIIPSAWAILEYLRSHIGGGIGWNLLAYSQYENLHLIQIADITGAYGVSFLIVLVNFTLFSGIKTAIRYRRRRKTFLASSELSFRQETKATPFFQILTVFLIIIFVTVYGKKRLEKLAGHSGTAEVISVSVIQGNIEQLHKWDKAYKGHILAAYRKLTLEAAKDKPDIIIWPETSLPGFPDEEPGLMNYVRLLARKADRPLLVGAPTKAVNNGRCRSDYNSTLLFSRQGDLIRQHNKLHLVLFGEFIPLSRYLPCLYRVLPLTGNFIPGSKYTIFRLKAPSLSFGTLICFEDIFPGLVRRFAAKGADFLVNMTNDAWFGKTCAVYQHASNSVFRAIENRRPFIRSANTGLSCFIDRLGNIKPAKPFKQGYETFSVFVYPGSGLTFYTRFGDIFILLCFVAAAVFLIDYTYLRKYNN